MAKEVEKKFKVLSEVKKLLLFLSSLGFGAGKKETQTDVYWDTSDFKIINLKRGLRLRNGSKLEFKSLFKKQNGEYVVEEIEIGNGTIDKSKLMEILVTRLNVCESGSFDNINFSEDIKTVLKNLGLNPMLVLKKERIVYENGEFEVCIDAIKGYPPYLEVESKSKEEHKLLEFTSELVRKVKLAEVQQGYLDIIFSSLPNIFSPEEFKKKFDKQFNWNVLPGERKLVLELLK
jgi:adenylate cyclase class IV